MRRITSLALVVVSVAAMFVLGAATPAKAAVFVVDTTSDAPDANPDDGACAIAGGGCSLRAALQVAASDADSADEIRVTIPGDVDNGSQAHVINVVNGQLPTIQNNTTIEAYQYQSGVHGRPKIILNGAGVGEEGHGLFIAGSNNEIRGLVIQNFPGDGLNIVGDNNFIRTMHIGTDADADSDVGNGGNGITIWDADDNRVEGAFIVGNEGDGVYIANGASGNEIYRTSIGIGRTGNAIGNQGVGVYISGASDNTIGAPNGPANFPINENEIGFNGGSGVYVCGNNPCGLDTFDLPASGNRIQNNYIGVADFGATDQGNNFDGIELDEATQTIIIDNVISGNDRYGIHIRNASSNSQVQGNRIGTNPAGNTDVGNTNDGVRVLGSTSPVIDSNLIAGNNGHGVFLGGGTLAAVVLRNELGKAGIPNNAAGIANHSATATQIGSTIANEGNTITGNNGPGVRIVNAGGAMVLRNVIHANGGLGIDSGADGVTPNDDPDSPGSPLNFPVITEATATDGLDEIHGTVLAAPNETYRLEVFANDSCDSSGHGEGQTFVIHTDLVTDALGAFGFGIGTPQDISGKFVTATLTGTFTGETSEFSGCVPVMNEDGSEPLQGTVELEVTTPQVDTSPTRVPFDHIPLQPQAPALETAPLDLKGLGVLPLDLKGLGILPLDLKGLGILPLLDLKGLGILPLDLKGLGILPLDLKGLGILPLIDLKGLGILPLVEEALCSITLDRAPIVDGWERLLAGSALAGKPLQTIRLCDLGQLTDANHRLLEQTKMYELGWANPLGALSIYSTMLGLTSIGDIDIESLDDDPQARHTWQSRLEKLGFSCAQLTRPGAQSCLDTSLLELELAGVPHDVSEADRFPRLHAVPFGDVDAANAPVLQVKLDHIDMPNTNFGAIEIADLDVASDVVAPDCTGCETLADAEDAGKIVDTATIAHLGATINGFTLGEIAYGLVPASSRALDSMPLDTLGIETYDAEGSSNLAEFRVRFTPTNRTTEGNYVATVTLPESFTYKAGSVSDGCGDGECPEIEESVEGSNVTFTVGQSIGVLDTYELVFTAFTGLELGTFPATARVQVDDLDVTSDPESVTVGDAFEPNDVIEDATEIEPGHLYISHPSRDIYEFDAPSELGSRVTVSLDHLQSDLDLVVCHPQTAPPPGGAPFRDPGAHQRAVALPDEGRGLVGDARILPQAGDIPIPCQGLTAGVSAHRGTDGEFVETLSTTTTGRFIVQVTKYFGEENSAGANEPYSLRVDVDPPTGDTTWDARVFLEDLEDPYGGADEAASIGTMPAQMADGTKTIILFNKGRIADDYGLDAANQLEAKLNTFAQHSAVVGSVLSVDAVPAVRDLLQARDETPSPELNNEVVRQVLREVDARLPGDPSTIENIVIVGGDEQFPMARLFDPTIKGNESGYASDVRFTGNRNALTDSLGSGYYLSDAPYGTFSPRPFLDRHLYVPEISIGRLVETAPEIMSQLDFFMSEGINGHIDATKAVVSAYDFNADLGQQLKTAKEARYGASNVNSLISPPGATNGWNGDQLRTAVNGAQDISLNGHFNHHALLPASGPPVAVDQIDLSRPDSVLYSIGCHSGMSVFDGYNAAGDNGPERDWPQEKATGGVYVAQTGFGYGSRGSVAMHEWIIREFGRNVDTGWQTAGQSLIFAQNAYLAEGVFDVFDEKVLHTTALFGLPMFRIGDAPQPPAPGFTSTQTDPISGLQVVTSHIEPDYDDPTTVGNDGTFDSIGGASVAAAGGPRVAKTPPIDVTNQTLRAHDSLPTALVTDEEDGRNPLLDYPVLADTGLEPEPEVADVVFPDVLPQLTVNRVSTAHGERDRLTAVTQQFRSTGFRDDGELVGEIETIREMDVSTFFAPASVDDFTRPTADRVDAVVQNGHVSFAVDAHDDSPDGITRVAILSRDETGVWQRSELTESASGTWLGGRPAQGDHVEFCAFIVDAAGNVLAMCDKGRLFDAVEDTSTPPTGIDVDIAGEAAPNAPWMRNAFVTITPSDPDVTVETSVNGASFTPHTAPVGFTEDDQGVHRLDYRTSDNRRDTILIAIDSEGPTADVTSPEDNASYVLRQNVTPIYTCDGGPSGITQCTGPATVDTSSAGAKTYTVTMEDGAGWETSRVVNYRVIYAFEGFLAPVANQPHINDPTAGQWIQMRWRLRDARGNQVTSLTTVNQLRSERVACPGQAAPAPNVESYPDTTSYSGGKFEFIWKTKSQWVNTCRDFVLTLKDGTQHRARFKFKGGLVIQLYYPGLIDLLVTIPS